MVLMCNASRSLGGELDLASSSNRPATQSEAAESGGAVARKRVSDRIATILEQTGLNSRASLARSSTVIEETSSEVAHHDPLVKKDSDPPQSQQHQRFGSMGDVSATVGEHGVKRRVEVRHCFAIEHQPSCAVL